MVAVIEIHMWRLTTFRPANAEGEKPALRTIDAAEAGRPACIAEQVATTIGPGLADVAAVGQPVEAVPFALADAAADGRGSRREGPAAPAEQVERLFTIEGVDGQPRKRLREHQVA